MVWLIKSCTANVKLYHNINLEGIKNFEEEEILKRSKRNIYGSISRYHYTNHDGKLLLDFFLILLVTWLLEFCILAFREYESESSVRKKSDGIIWESRKFRKFGISSLWLGNDWIQWPSNWWRLKIVETRDSRTVQCSVCSY